jgi:molybdopterin biosynthesis enzyme
MGIETIDKGDDIVRQRFDPGDVVRQDGEACREGDMLVPIGEGAVLAKALARAKQPLRSELRRIRTAAETRRLRQASIT